MVMLLLFCAFLLLVFSTSATIHQHFVVTALIPKKPRITSTFIPRTTTTKTTKTEDNHDVLSNTALLHVVTARTNLTTTTTTKTYLDDERWDDINPDESMDDPIPSAQCDNNNNDNNIRSSSSSSSNGGGGSHTTTMILLIHGLDSTSSTWNEIIPRLLQTVEEEQNDDTNKERHYYYDDRLVVAMDCRGCGDSSDDIVMDGEDDHENDDDSNYFSIDALADDVWSVVQHFAKKQEKKKKKKKMRLVLIGHSMGARIALAFVARYYYYYYCDHDNNNMTVSVDDVVPVPSLQALIMEDMDIATRSMASAPFQVAVDNKTITTRRRRPFQRAFDTKKQAMEALHQAGYPMDRIERFVQQGRIVCRVRDDDNDTSDGDYYYWWSHVNPDYRRLCYERVVCHDYGESDWRRSVAAATTTVGRKHRDLPCFPIHVLVAGPNHTICSEESLRTMQEIVQEEEEEEQGAVAEQLLTIHRFPPEATHSIHSSHSHEFVRLVNDIVRKTTETL